VTPDNFDAALGSMRPHLAFTVENKLSEDVDAAKLGVDLNFKSMDDFEPDRVAQQVAPLKALLDLREQLADLRGSLQGNDKLDELLNQAVSNTEKLAKLKAEIEAEKGGSNA
jgi:type VI secretion system protein ImpB